jgi:hypothetical protein
MPTDLDRTVPPWSILPIRASHEPTDAPGNRRNPCLPTQSARLTLPTTDRNHRCLVPPSLSRSSELAASARHTGDVPGKPHRPGHPTPPQPPISSDPASAMTDPPDQCGLANYGPATRQQSLRAQAPVPGPSSTRLS